MRSILHGFLLLMICSMTAVSQRGVIVIPAGGEIAVPLQAQICADTIFANRLGNGTLTIANAACICAGSVIIPVDFLTLSAWYHGSDVSLLWRTAAETNCAMYEVQRAATPDVWEPAGSVRGSGTTTQECAYGWIDHLTPELQRSGLLLYRLKQIDMDGSFRYSPVVSVALDLVPSTVALHAAFPNPASDRLTIRFTLPDAISARISVYSLGGRELAVFGGGELSMRGEHILSLNTSGICNGTYLLELLAGGSRLVRRFVIAR